MKKVIVKFEFDEEDLGEQWFNEYNLKTLLYDGNCRTKSDLLKVVSFREEGTVKVLEELKQLRDVQGSSGNWDYEPYMLGLYNGLELSVATLEDRDPIFKDAPKVWICDQDYADIDFSTESVETEKDINE